MKTMKFNQVSGFMEWEREAPTIVRFKGGSKERRVELGKVVIPDIWYVAQRIGGREGEAMLEVWHLAHDLRRELEELYRKL